MAAGAGWVVLREGEDAHRPRSGLQCPYFSRYTCRVQERSVAVEFAELSEASMYKHEKSWLPLTCQLNLLQYIVLSTRSTYLVRRVLYFLLHSVYPNCALDCLC